jgi:hypothetical protein
MTAAAEPIIIHASWALPLITILKTSLQPLYPIDQLVSRGQRNETAEFESSASAATWEKIKAKQLQKPKRGSHGHLSDALHAAKPAARANSRLWVGPR